MNKLTKRTQFLIILAMILLCIVGLLRVEKVCSDRRPTCVTVITAEAYAEEVEESTITEVIEYAEEQNEQIEEQIEEIIKPYTDEEVEVLTNLLYGEARGIKSDAQKAAVIWCVLNRVDNGKYGDSIIAVATAKNQFCGYKKDRVYKDLDSYYHCNDIVIDVLERYFTEEQEGRTLPSDYLYFVAKNGVNVFTKTWKGTSYWDWSLKSPYEE